MLRSHSIGRSPTLSAVSLTNVGAVATVTIR
jgi:hypothetical protein